MIGTVAVPLTAHQSHQFWGLVAEYIGPVLQPRRGLLQQSLCAKCQFIRVQDVVR